MALPERPERIGQISRAVAEIDKVTQQSAANSEESSSAASELSRQSERLAEMLDTLQLRARAAREVPLGSSADLARATRRPRVANGVAAGVN